MILADQLVLFTQSIGYDINYVLVPPCDEFACVSKIANSQHWHSRFQAALLTRNPHQTRPLFLRYP
jgi:hypothetical protein